MIFIILSHEYSSWSSRMETVGWTSWALQNRFCRECEAFLLVSLKLVWCEAVTWNVVMSIRLLMSTLFHATVCLFALDCHLPTRCHSRFESIWTKYYLLVKSHGSRVFRQLALIRIPTFWFGLLPTRFFIFVGILVLSAVVRELFLWAASW